MLPDRSVLIGQKLVENAKIEKFKCDILGDFQTLCSRNTYFFNLRFIFRIRQHIQDQIVGVDHTLISHNHHECVTHDKSSGILFDG